MHCTDKSMLTMPRPKEISERVKSIQLLGPSIGTIQCSRTAEECNAVSDMSSNTTISYKYSFRITAASMLVAQSS
jgi:hypothetical protein